MKRHLKEVFILMCMICWASIRSSAQTIPPTTTPIPFNPPNLINRYNNYQTRKPVKHISNRNWVLGTDFTHGIYIDKYWNKQKYKLQFIAYNQTTSCNKFGLDLERVLSTHNNIIDISFSFGPSLRYQFGSCNLGNQPAYNYITGAQYYTPDSSVSINSLFLNFRIGSEITFYDRVVFHANIGYGYSTQEWGLVGDPRISNTFNSHENMDYEFFLGYKFGVKHHRHKQSTVLKYAPQIVLPGWTDYKLSSSKKGKFKMGLFLSSAAVAIGSKIYSNSEYSTYANCSNPEKNIGHYNNANFANKVFLTSSGVALSVYIFDVVHFCNKIKSLK